MWDQYIKSDLRPALMGIKRIHGEVCGAVSLLLTAAQLSCGGRENECRQRWSAEGGTTLEARRREWSQNWGGVPDSDFRASILIRRIDGAPEDGYSQAQIPDLVAHAIPRFLPSAQSSGVLLLWALQPSITHQHLT